jgi:hypothetical protein
MPTGLLNPSNTMSRLTLWRAGRLDAVEPVAPGVEVSVEPSPVVVEPSPAVVVVSPAMGWLDVGLVPS